MMPSPLLFFSTHHWLVSFLCASYLRIRGDFKSYIELTFQNEVHEMSNMI